MQLPRNCTVLSREKARDVKAARRLVSNDLVAAFPAEITAVSLAKPTLEDVFIARTGHRFWEMKEESAK